ncbi:unnamed protein product, partial [Symbiodinium microadriaticum]
MRALCHGFLLEQRYRGGAKAHESRVFHGPYARRLHHPREAHRLRLHPAFLPGLLAQRGAVLLLQCLNEHRDNRAADAPGSQRDIHRNDQRVPPLRAVSSRRGHDGVCGGSARKWAVRQGRDDVPGSKLHTGRGMGGRHRLRFAVADQYCAQEHGDVLPLLPLAVHVHFH